MTASGAAAWLFFFQAEDGIRDLTVTGVQTCALPICDFESAPTRVASTLPFLNSISVGMPRMPNFAGTLWFSSTLILAIFSRPSYSLATSSSIGAIDLQGPHHSAQ